MLDTIFRGDAPQVLKSLPSSSVQTCITSPPYFGLRDYGVRGQMGLEQHRIYTFKEWLNYLEKCAACFEMTERCGLILEIAIRPEVEAAAANRTPTWAPLVSDHGR